MSKKSKSKKRSSKLSKHQEPIEELDPESDSEDAFEEIPDAEENSDDSLKDLMEKYGDVESEDEPPKKLESIPHKKSKRPDESKGKKKKRPDKVGEREPDHEKGKKGESIKKSGEPQKKGKPKEKRKGKEPQRKDAKGKTKPGKQKGKGKPKKKPKTARKLKLPDKARKLPIEEADSDVEIDWSFEAPVIDDPELADFERSRLNEQLKYSEREKINMSNELVFMKTDLDQKTQLVDELKKDYEKLRKDFDNYKKRVRGEIKDKMKFASEPLLLEVLDVLDNFDRTNKLDLQTADKEDLIKGIQMIQKQLLDVLKKDGLSVIEAQGKPFDPYVYDAVSTTHTDDHPHNTVLEEFQKGYKYKKKVIRATKVRVSQSDVVPEIPIVRDKPKKPKKGKEQEEPKKTKKTEKPIKKKKDKLATETKVSKKEGPGKLDKKRKKPEGAGKGDLKKPDKHKKRMPDFGHQKMKHRPGSESKKKMIGKKFKKKYSNEELKRMKARKKKTRADE